MTHLSWDFLFRSMLCASRFAGFAGCWSLDWSTSRQVCRILRDGLAAFTKSGKELGRREHLVWARDPVACWRQMASNEACLKHVGAVVRQGLQAELLRYVFNVGLQLCLLARELSGVARLDLALVLRVAVEGPQLARCLRKAINGCWVFRLDQPDVRIAATPANEVYFCRQVRDAQTSVVARLHARDGLEPDFLKLPLKCSLERLVPQ